MADHGAGLSPVGALALLAGLAGMLGYLAAVQADAGRHWPPHRSVAWVAGVTVLLTGSVGPLATAAHTSFIAHAVSHLLVGMLGPLLLVLGAPVTLALRALPVAGARRLTAALRSRPLRLLTEPVVVALFNLGGLWLLYTTSLFGLARHDPTVHLLVHLHLVAAGYLLPAVLIGPDPLPHRRGFAYRSAVLVAAMAAHAILAKRLYARPPTDVGSGAETGAMLMYYGGDLVELVVAVLLCRQWFAVRPFRRVALGTR